MGFRDGLRAGLAKYDGGSTAREPERYQPGSREKPGPTPPGNFSFGTTWLGGPLYTDPFQNKRAPSPWQLVENYNSLVYAMVARNANAVARIPLRLYADGSRAQGGKPRSACDPIKVSRHIGTRLARAGVVSPGAVDQVYEIRNHQLITLLDRPDPYGYFTRKKLLRVLCAGMDVVGSSFWVPDGNGWNWKQPEKRSSMPPEFLWNIYSQYVTPIRYPGQPLIDYFQYFSDRIPFESVMWFRHTHSLRDAYGSSFSPTYAGETYREQEQRFIQILSQVLGLGPRPNIIASAKDPTQPPNKIQRQRLEQDFNRRHSGGNAGGMFVNDGAWDITPVSYSPTDLAGKEVSEYDLYRLASIFDQPPTYYTIDTNINNLEAADEQHAKTGIQPRCDTISDQLTWFARMFDPRLSWQFDPVLEEDEESKIKVIEMRLKNGLTTPNQENEESRWPTFPEGDEHWIEGTRKTMSMILEQHEQALEQGQAAIDSQDMNDGLAVDEHEHGKQMDKKKLQQGAKEPARSLEERLESQIVAMERSLMEMGIAV